MFLPGGSLHGAVSGAYVETKAGMCSTWSLPKLVRRAPAAAAAAASACGLTKGLLDGTRSSLSVWAKKQTRRLQLVPSLHSCVRYLRPERHHP